MVLCSYILYASYSYVAPKTVNHDAGVNSYDVRTYSLRQNCNFRHILQLVNRTSKETYTKIIYVLLCHQCPIQRHWNHHKLSSQNLKTPKNANIWKTRCQVYHELVALNVTIFSPDTHPPCDIARIFCLSLLEYISITCQFFRKCIKSTLLNMDLKWHWIEQSCLV